MFIAGKKSFPSTTTTISALTLTSQTTKVGDLSKQEYIDYLSLYI
jgi:hypothetical protein